LRALRRLEGENPASPFVFVSERGSPFTEAGFARMLERAAMTASLELKAHPHMLHHACGYALANKGHDTPRKPRVAQASVYYQTAIYTTLGRTSLRISGGIKSAPIRAATDHSPSSRSFDPALAVARYSRRKTHPVSLPSAEILRPG
jgi:hypothetical protein